MSDRHAVEFRVVGTPAPQGSKTVARTRSGGSFVRDDNPHTAPWRNAVAAAAAAAMNGRAPLTGPLFVEASFTFPRPKAHYRTGRHADELKPSAPVWHRTKPDLDKLLRAIGDAITGIVCVDDTQLVEVCAAKTYTRPGQPPGLVCAVEQLLEQPAWGHR